MRVAYGMKLKDVIGYLNGLDRVVVTQTDAYLAGTPSENDVEEVYRGSIMDIPWYLLDYYLDNSLDGEAIGVFMLDGDPYLEIALCEEFDRLPAVKSMRKVEEIQF